MKSDDTVKWKIGKSIKKYRDIKGLTQLDLANKVGISRNGLWNYENDKRAIDHDTLIQISEVLEVGVSDLLGLDEDDRVSLLSFDKLLDSLVIDKVKNLENHIKVVWSDNEINAALVIQNILIDWFAKQEAYSEVYNDNSLTKNFEEIGDRWMTGLDLYELLHNYYSTSFTIEKMARELRNLYDLARVENLDNPSQFFIHSIKDYAQEFGVIDLSTPLRRLIEDSDDIKLAEKNKPPYRTPPSVVFKDFMEKSESEEGE